MKTILLFLVAAFAVIANSETNSLTQTCETPSRRSSIIESNLHKRPLSSGIDDRTHWSRNSDSNTVTVSLCTGVVSGVFPVFRDFTFDKEGRLVSISPINKAEWHHQINGKPTLTLPQLDKLRDAAKEEMNNPSKK